MLFTKILTRSNRDWRFEFPRWDMDTCTLCDLCYLSCPDSAIVKNSDGGGYKADEAFCKGCGLCAGQCPAGSISLSPEAEKAPWLTKK